MNRKIFFDKVRATLFGGALEGAVAATAADVLVTNTNASLTAANATAAQSYATSAQAARGVTPTSAPNNTTADPATRHLWDFQFTATQAIAAAIATNGTTLLTLTETL